MKKSLRIILAGLLLAVLVGCNAKTEPEFQTGYEALALPCDLQEEQKAEQPEDTGPYLVPRDFIITTAASNWQGPLDWERVYVGGYFLGMRLEAIHRDAVDRSMTLRSFVSLCADFSGEIAVQGHIVINLCQRTVRYIAQLAVGPSYWDYFPILNERGHSFPEELRINIRNWEHLLAYFGLEIPETGFKEFAVADVSAVIANFSVSDWGFYYWPRMDADLILPMASYTEPELVIEIIEVDYITLRNPHDASGLSFQDFHVGDEFMGLVVEYAWSNRSRSAEEGNFYTVFQSATLSGGLMRLRGGITLTITVSGPEAVSPGTRLNIWFTANEYYVRFLPANKTNTYMMSTGGENEVELYRILGMLGINFDELEFEKFNEHRYEAIIEIPDVYLTITGLEMSDEWRGIWLYFSLEDLYSIEIINNPR